MPRFPKDHVPQPTRRVDGRAVVRIDGVDYYLGMHGSKPAGDEYNRLIALWLANGRRMPHAGPQAAPVTIRETLHAFMNHASEHYRKNGRPTSEFSNYVIAIRPVRQLFADTPAREFGPLALEACRAELVRGGKRGPMVRAVVNRMVGRIRSVFRWALGRQMIPAEVVVGLESLAPLLRGRCKAPESEPVTAVPESDLAATLPHLSPAVRALVELQLWSGCRPGEAVSMRAADIDMTGAVVGGVAVWVYRPAAHKTEHHEKDRAIFLGPKAQAVIKPRLTGDASAPLFSPDAKRWRKRGKAFTVSGYRQSIDRACVDAALLDILNREPSRLVGIEAAWATWRAAESAYGTSAFRHAKPAKAVRDELRKTATAAEKSFRKLLAEAVEATDATRPWHPHQLRHNAAERLEAEHGIEAAQYVLGHATADMTRVYSQAHRRKAAEVMGKSG